MAKKEKVVDLKPEKITEDQLRKAQEFISNLNRAQGEIGILETKKHILLYFYNILTNLSIIKKYKDLG